MNRTTEYDKKVRDYMRNTGKNLKDWRLRCGKTQKEVAEYIGITQATYSVFERGGIDSLYMYFKTVEFLMKEMGNTWEVT